MNIQTFLTIVEGILAVIGAFSLFAVGVLFIAHALNRKEVRLKK